MLLQITYQDKATQTEKENTIEEILKAMTLLCTKVENIDKELQQIRSQQHDYTNVELSRSEDFKNPDLKGDVGKHLKTHNVCLNTAAGTSKQVSEKQHKNTNLNQLFERSFTPRTPKNTLAMEPQTSTYVDSLQNEKKII